MFRGLAPLLFFGTACSSFVLTTNFLAEQQKKTQDQNSLAASIMSSSAAAAGAGDGASSSALPTPVVVAAAEPAVPPPPPPPPPAPAPAAAPPPPAPKKKKKTEKSPEKQKEQVASTKTTTTTTPPTPTPTITPGEWVDKLPEFTLDDIAKNCGGDDPFALLDAPCLSNSSEGQNQNQNQKQHQDRVWVHFRSGVYDVTEFLSDHPGGGKRLLLAAGGAIEPWWRQFTCHNQDEVFKTLEGLRIGNVAGTRDSKFEPLPSGSAGCDGESSVDGNDMWANEPVAGRDPSLIVHTQRPFNAETPAATLSEPGLTSNAKHFVRHHLPVPKIDLDDFCLELSSDTEGIFKNLNNNSDNNNNNNEESTSQLCPTLQQLKELFPERTVANTIQCGGNRRSEAMDKYPGRSVKGTPWAAGAISTSEWSGASLRDLLLHFTNEGVLEKLVEAETKPQQQENEKEKNENNNNSNLVGQIGKLGTRYHVHFSGADGDAAANFEISVPLHMVLDPNRDALVAWRMNGDDIPLDHGFPLRAIVPGTVGVRNCKWLNGIAIRKHESLCDWQQRDYRAFPPWETSAKDAQQYQVVYEMPVQSAVTEAWSQVKKNKNKNNSKNKNAKMNEDDNDISVAAVGAGGGGGGGANVDDEKMGFIRGWAYSGGGRAVQRVEVSVDGGKNFTRAAQLTDGGIKQLPGKRWAWKHFNAKFPLPKIENGTGGEEEKHRICVRAVTDSNDVQPPVAEYNFRGLFFNGYSCVEI